MNFVERVGNTVVRLPVDDEGGPRRHLLPSGDSRPFDLGLMSVPCSVSLMQRHVPCPSGLRQPHLDLWRFAFSLSVWVIISVLHWGVDLRPLSPHTIYPDMPFQNVSDSRETMPVWLQLKHANIQSSEDEMSIYLV